MESFLHEAPIIESLGDFFTGRSSLSTREEIGEGAFEGW